MVPETVRWDRDTRAFEGRFEDDELGGRVRIPDAMLVHCVFTPCADSSTAIAPSPMDQIADVVVAGLFLDQRQADYYRRGTRRYLLSFPETSRQQRWRRTSGIRFGIT